jgi:NAD(P)-dependent dehydrogenase (short-subunit alcohol dehydrogenase family)
MSDPQAITDHFWKTEEQSWADTFKTNVTGVYYMSMAFLPLLAKGREVTPGYTSSVVNVTSISGFMKGSSSGQFAYASSKAAATHLTRMLATTFAQTKVRVNCIAPGVFPSEVRVVTPQYGPVADCLQMTTGESGEDNKSKIEGGMSNPAGRPGADADMAASILFLAGPGGVFYNEQILFPDGGQYIDFSSAAQANTLQATRSCSQQRSRQTAQVAANNIAACILVGIS